MSPARKVTAAKGKTASPRKTKAGIAAKKKTPGKALSSLSGKTAGKKKTIASKSAKPSKNKLSATKGGAPARKAPARKPAKKVQGPVSAKKPAAANKVKIKSPAALKTEPKNRLQEVRKQLIQKRESIVREAKEEIAKYISGETRQLVDTAIDEGDWAVVDISEDISLMRLGAHRKTLLDIDEVLRKLNEGTYGICEECGEEISEKRLQVIPTATLCITCQENKERFESVSREETP